MIISTSNAPAAELEADAIVLALPQDPDKPTPWEAVDARYGGVLSDALARGAFQGKRNQVLALSVGGGRARELVLVGLGPEADIDTESWRQAVATAADRARRRGNRKIAIPIPDDDAAALAAAATEAVRLSSYHYDEFKAAPADRIDIDELLVAAATDVADVTARARVIADATCFARDLINTPSNEKRPPALADRAVAMAEEVGLHCTVIDDAEAAALGLRALLAVGQGASEKPRLVILEHRPAGATGGPTAIVGKGITFDTGGISLKPPGKMDAMKGDMSGAAAVFGAMRAVAALAVPRRVVGVAPLAENMPSSTAYRPSDIIRAYDGTTIEVLNTDAEGRVVLADALAYTRAHFKPRCMVDLATLTGACVVALGSHAAGLMSSDDTLAEQLLASGESTGERLWRLPAWPAYDRMVDSEVANVRNSAGRAAGVLTAGMFLKRFVGDTPWAHLDIAGTAYLSKATPYQPKGGSGFGVRLLVDWLSR